MINEENWLVKTYCLILKIFNDSNSVLRWLHAFFTLNAYVDVITVISLRLSAKHINTSCDVLGWHCHQKHQPTCVAFFRNGHIHVHTTIIIFCDTKPHTTSRTRVSGFSDLHGRAWNEDKNFAHHNGRIYSKDIRIARAIEKRQRRWSRTTIIYAVTINDDVTRDQNDFIIATSVGEGGWVRYWEFSRITVTVYKNKSDNRRYRTTLKIQKQMTNTTLSLPNYSIQ